MIIKGTSCAGAGRLAVHLSRTDTNERAELKEVRGVAAERLRDALKEMEALAAGARTTKPFYHASINTRADERLTDVQRQQAINRLESELGLSGQPRVVVVHEKEGREHCHIVWSRIDLENMRAISDSYNYAKHEKVARQLEREFSHARVQGAHVERDGQERPGRTPSHAEMLQAERTGMSPKEAKERITEIWQRTDNGPSFAVALSEAGFVLARGDRRDFVVIDPNGGIHSLARRVEGATAKDIRERMVGVDPARLPSIAQAKLQLAQRARDRAQTSEATRESSAAAPILGLQTAPTREPPAHTPIFAPTADRGVSRGTPEGPGAPARIANAPGRIAASVLDGLASIVERGLTGSAAAQSDHAREAPAPEPQPDPQQVQHEASVHAQQEAAKQRREGFLREFGRELPSEHEADIERGRERERERWGE